jgi:hypothetical protein
LKQILPRDNRHHPTIGAEVVLGVEAAIATIVEGVLCATIEVTHIFLLLLCVKSTKNMAILLASATIILISPINILLLLQINMLLLQQIMTTGRMTGMQTQAHHITHDMANLNLKR